MPDEPVMGAGARVARVLFSPELLLGLCRGRYEIVDNPVPADARVVSAGWDIERHAVYITVESEALKMVETFSYVPVLEAPTIRRLDDPAEHIRSLDDPAKQPAR